jgi:hypothetical protein
MKTASLSNMSTSGSVTSPCTSSGISFLYIASRAGRHRLMSVTPESAKTVHQTVDYNTVQVMATTSHPCH